MTLVERPHTPKLVAPIEPMEGAVTCRERGSTCGCVDPELDKLLDLMNRGVSQVEASRMLWGDPRRLDPVPATPTVPEQPMFLTRWWWG